MRSISAIQADLDAAYATRSRLIKAGAQAVTQPAAGGTTFLTLDQINAQITALQSELDRASEAQASVSSGGFTVHQVKGLR